MIQKRLKERDGGEIGSPPIPDPKLSKRHHPTSNIDPKFNVRIGIKKANPRKGRPRRPSKITARPGKGGFLVFWCWFLEACGGVIGRLIVSDCFVGG